jgi:hypothetical protein
MKTSYFDDLNDNLKFLYKLKLDYSLGELNTIYHKHKSENIEN